MFMKKILSLIMAITICCGSLTACSGTFNPAEASSLEIQANGVVVQVASASGDKGYDALIEALSGGVYKGELEDCSLGDIVLTFTIDGEEVKVYPCCDDNCEYVVVGSIDSEKKEYLKISDDDRKAIFDFINTYAS